MVIFPAIDAGYISVQLLLFSLEVLSLIFKDPSNKFIWWLQAHFVDKIVQEDISIKK